MPETELNTEKERPLLSCFDMTSDALVELPRRDVLHGIYARWECSDYDKPQLMLHMPGNGLNKV